MQFIADNGSCNLITGTFSAEKAPRVDLLSIQSEDGYPVAVIPRPGPCAGTAVEPLQIHLKRSSACLVVSLPPAYTGVCEVRDFAGNVIFTTDPYSNLKSQNDGPDQTRPG